MAENRLAAVWLHHHPKTIDAPLDPPSPPFYTLASLTIAEEGAQVPQDVALRDGPVDVGDDEPRAPRHEVDVG